MTSRLLIGVMVLGFGGVVGGCRTTAPGARLAAGEESISFFGTGRARLDFARMEPIGFAPGSWEISETGLARVRAVAHVLAGGERVFLVGVGDADVPAEHGRQQALARALTVRRWLVERGAPSDLILVSGLAAVEAEGVIGGGSGPRVECAVVR